MKAGIVSQHGRVECAQMPDPVPGPYDCLVKIDACATCTGTDLNIIRGSFPWLTDVPFVLGHESTGVIVEVGEKVRNFSPGQRVTRPAAVLPGERSEGIGSNWGGFAEMGLVRDSQAAAEDGAGPAGMSSLSRVPLPDDVDPVSAALSINLREILSVVDRFELGPDSRVVVVGSGYNGLLFSFFSARRGAGQVLMVGNPAREPLARATFGAGHFADYRGESVPESVKRSLGSEPTHVVDAVGSVASVRLCAGLLARDTAFGCYGVHEYEAAQPLVAELLKAHPKLNMKTDEPGATDRWYAMWREGAFAREGFYGGVLPLDRIAQAFELLERRQAVKLILMP